MPAGGLIFDQPRHQNTNGRNVPARDIPRSSALNLKQALAVSRQRLEQLSLSFNPG